MNYPSSRKQYKSVLEIRQTKQHTYPQCYQQFFQGNEVAAMQLSYGKPRQLG